MKFIYILLISISCLTLVGCGGGGGGDNGIVLTPQQQEFADVVYAFAAAINDKNKEEAKSFIMADVIYNKNKTNGYKEFKDRLENFIDKAENINFQIDNIGVELELLDSYDELARIRANVTINYNTDKVITEMLEINIEKSGTGENNKGITLFRKYSDDISAFPPVLE